MSSKYFEVEKILDKKIIKGEPKYLIKWIGWDEDDSTWEPLENLTNIIPMVNKFEKKIMEEGGNENTLTKIKEIMKSKNNISLDKKRKESKSKSKSKSISRSRSRTRSPLKRVKSKKEMNLLKSERSPGNIECDLPKKIISGKLIENNQEEGSEVICIIEWKPRINGIQPQDSAISNKVLREKYPQLLIDYYESKLKHPYKNK